MLLDDPALPAVPHLTGDGAADVVGAAVTAAGGVLHRLRVSHVQYRPGADLVVRYRAEVTWGDGTRRSETLLAAAHRDGALAGTIPVIAEGDGETLVASVWRWPFDPVVVGLAAAVTPGATDHLVRAAVGATTDVEVVAYRPTERAVVRVRGRHGTAYLKVVPPAEVAALADRHRRLHRAGLPVPEVLAVSEPDGVVVLAELAGTTMRERIKGDLSGWPDADAVDDLLARLHALPADAVNGRGSRIADGRGHAALLATVLPQLAPQLDLLSARFAAEADAVRARSGTMVHGDLHEGQLVVDPRGAITGLLDIDDVGAGDPVDDLATLAAHLRFRASVLDADAPATRRRRLLASSDALRGRAARRHGTEAADVAVAAVLVGLATGPFRLQRDGWDEAVAATVADAAAVAGLEIPKMRQFSAAPHAALTATPHRGT